MNLQGRYGLPASCECFCRGATAGRLPASVLLVFEFFFEACILLLELTAVGIRKSIQAGGHFVLGCFLVGLGVDHSCTVHEGRRGVSGYSRIFLA